MFITVTKIQVCLMTKRKNGRLVSFYPPGASWWLRFPLRLCRYAVRVLINIPLPRCRRFLCFSPSSAISVYLIFSFCPGKAKYVPLCGRSMNEEKKGGDILVQKTTRLFKESQTRFEQTSHLFFLKTSDAPDLGHLSGVL